MDGHRRNKLGTATPAQLVGAELGRSEKLIWAGTPVSIRQHAQSAISKALFGIPFLAFAIFWTWQASSQLRHGTNSEIGGFEYFFPMFGIPFILTGLGLTLSPAWEAVKAMGTVYGLTDQRLMICESFPRMKVSSWSLNQLGPLSRTGPAQGPGCLYFGSETTHNSGWDDDEPKKKKIGFLGIDQPKYLEDLVRPMMRQQSK